MAFLPSESAFGSAVEKHDAPPDRGSILLNSVQDSSSARRYAAVFLQGKASRNCLPDRLRSDTAAS